MLNLTMQINTIKWMVLLNVVLFSMIVFISLVCFKGADRVKVVGWFNMTFSVSVFAAPLSIIVRNTLISLLLHFLSHAKSVRRKTACP